MAAIRDAANRLVGASYELGRHLLADDEPQRWTHSIGVARLAADLAGTLGADESVVAAANLHDIGYATPVRRTGLHPLDGATYLRAEGWPDVVCELVAHHTSADAEAAVRGLTAELEQFPSPVCDLADLLTYSDLHTSPTGEWVTVADRMSEILGRYGPPAPPHQALTETRHDLLAVISRVERRLDDARLARH